MKGIKVLLGPALALVALAAAPTVASAGIGAGEYPATLKGEGDGRMYIGAGSNVIGCDPLDFEADLGQYESSVTTTSVPDPTNCGSKKNYVHMNGCQLELNTAGAGSVDIGPPECGGITFKLTVCPGEIEMPAQSGIPVEYRNIGPPGEDASFEVEIRSTEVEVAGSCGGGSGRLEAEIDVTAANAAEESVGVQAYIGGLSMGEGAEGAAELEAAEYPVPIVGEQGDFPPPGVTELLDATAKPMVCETVAYDGGMLEGPATSLTLEADYSGCKVGLLPIDVVMSSCRYVLSGFEYQEPVNATGATDIACDEGDGISIPIYTSYSAQEKGNPFCTVEIPAQTLSGGLTALIGNSTLGNGNELGLAAVVTATELNYTVSGSFCGLAGLKVGSYEDGGSEYDIWLQALYE